MKINQNEIIEKMISNDECLDAILKADNNNEVKKIFVKYGISLTDEQIETIKENFKKNHHFWINRYHRYHLFLHHVWSLELCKKFICNNSNANHDT